MYSNKGKMTVYCGMASYVKEGVINLKYECIKDLVRCNGCTCDYITKNRKRSDEAVKKIAVKKTKRQKTWNNATGKWKTVYSYWLFKLIKYEIRRYGVHYENVPDHKTWIERTYKITFK